MENKHEGKTGPTKHPAAAVLLKILLTLAAAGAAYLVAAVAEILLRSEDIHLPVIYLSVYLPGILFLPGIWVKQRKKYWKKWLMVTALCLAVLAADFGLVKYDASLKVDTHRYDNIAENLLEYVPFRDDSPIAKSETLLLEDDLPVMDGTVALFPLYSAFMHATYPETAEFNFGSFDSVKSWGYQDLAEGVSDLFLTLEEPTEAQAAHAQSLAVNYACTNIGTEALVFIVDKDNPVDNLTVEQLRGIYSGAVTNWQELGGKNQKITAYQNPADSGAQQMMARFMGQTPLMAAPTEMVYNDLYALEEDCAVYRNKSGSIGFAFRYCVQDNPDIKYLCVDGVAPTPENVENGSYPVVTPILAVTREDNANENVDRLLAWMLTEEGQHIVKQIGYAGVLPG